LAGRLLSHRVLSANSPEANAIDLRNNVLRVAEPEFVFRLAHALPARSPGNAPYTQEEVMLAVDSLHLAIEIPDTRLADFVHAGTASLIADFACAAWWVLGPAVASTWRTLDLSQHEVVAYKNGRIAATGSGANVLGDPRSALTWIANELAAYEGGLKAGDYVTTGTSVVPVPIMAGDTLTMDFGALGRICANCAAF
jgi:2-keto-4-pentenoate hydratase